MALTYTPEPEIGRRCPEFILSAVDGKTYSLKDFSKSKILVVMFICNHCPYVKAVEDRFIALGNYFETSDVAFVAICANEPTDYPEDSFEKLKERWKEKKYPFPYLHDREQVVARNFDAVCTPDFFVYDQNRHLSYRGRLDDNWKDASKVKSEDLKLAIQDILKKQKVSFRQYPSMGCSIKWIHNEGT